METPKLEPMTVGFIFTHDLSQVLLLRKNRPEWQKGLLNGVGGHVEDEEWIKGKWEEAWKREVFEEVNVLIPEDTAVRVGRITVSNRGIIVPIYAYRLGPSQFPAVKQMTDEVIEWHDPYRLVDQKCIENLIFLVTFAQYKLRHSADLKDGSRIELHYDYN